MVLLIWYHAWVQLIIRTEKPLLHMFAWIWGHEGSWTSLVLFVCWFIPCCCCCYFLCVGRFQVSRGDVYRSWYWGNTVCIYPEVHLVSLKIKMVDMTFRISQASLQVADEPFFKQRIWQSFPVGPKFYEISGCYYFLPSLVWRKNKLVLNSLLFAEKYFFLNSPCPCKVLHLLIN